MQKQFNVPRQISSQYYLNLKQYTNKAPMLFGFFNSSPQVNQTQKNNQPNHSIMQNNTDQQNKFTKRELPLTRKISLSKDFTDIGSIRQENAKNTQRGQSKVLSSRQRQNKFPQKLQSKKQLQNIIMKKQVGSDNSQHTQKPLNLSQLGQTGKNKQKQIVKKNKSYDQKEEIANLITLYSSTNSTQQLTKKEFEQLIHDVYHNMCGRNCLLNRDQMNTIMLLVDSDQNGIISKQELSRIVTDNNYKPTEKLIDPKKSMQ